MLIKGPIIYAFLLPGIVLFQTRRGMVRPPGAPTTISRSAWPGWWPWIASLAIFLVWVAGGIRFQPGFYEEVVMREFVGRFGETIHRPQPLLFYLPHLLHKLAPWSVLMIGIALFDVRSRNSRLRAVFREMSLETFWLLCWSIGGLLVMSLIPSKRVDRIFPVIPPLCLLLAAQIGGRDAALRRPVGAARRPYLWTVAVLVLAILFTSGYTGWKVITGYRHHRDGLAVFGRNVRHEAEAHHWRYEVMSAKDEGLLLYLRKTHFVEPADAVTEWNVGNLDALVASQQKAAVLMNELEGNAVARSEPSKQDQYQQGRGYVLITR
jgi:hypothetical protein